MPWVVAREVNATSEILLNCSQMRCLNGLPDIRRKRLLLVCSIFSGRKFPDRILQPDILVRNGSGASTQQEAGDRSTEVREEPPLRSRAMLLVADHGSLTGNSERIRDELARSRVGYLA